MRPSAIEAHSVAYFGEAPKPFLLNGARRGSQGLALSGVMAAWGESCGSDVWHHGWKGHNWDNRVGTWHDYWWYDDGLWYDWRHEDGWPEREQGQVFGSSEPAGSKPLPLPVGRVKIGNVKQCENPPAVSLKRKREKLPQSGILGKLPQRTSKLRRAITYIITTNLSTLLEGPFASDMDITDVHRFWESLDTAMDAHQRARALLQESAVEERKTKAVTTIQTFLRDRIFPMIRLRTWTEPSNPEKWPHYHDVMEVAGEYWERKDGCTIRGRKASFQRLVWEVFCDIVRTENLRPYHDSIRTSILSILKEAEETPDGDADCISGVDDAVQGGDFEAKRKFYQEKATEALNATTVLQEMSWRHSCPNTMEHWVCFEAIMNFCREFLRNAQLHGVQDFYAEERLPIFHGFGGRGPQTQ